MKNNSITLKEETIFVKNQINVLNTYMSTNEFYMLPRVEKDLIYAQQRAMSKYLQVLGKRCELHNITLS